MSATAIHPSTYLQEELDARGWTTRDCAERMGGDANLFQLTLDMYLACGTSAHHAASVTIGQEAADGLSRAFGSNAETWLRLEAEYKRQVRIAN